MSTPTPAPTPETDAHVDQTKWEDGNPHTVSAYFARDLERQRDEARLNAKYGWQRAAEKDAAYGEMIKERDEAAAKLETVISDYNAFRKATVDVVAERDALKAEVAEQSQKAERYFLAYTEEAKKGDEMRAEIATLKADKEGKC